jgi:hypothetical protein
VTFNMNGAQVGPRDVVVRNPDGKSASLGGGFIVESGGSPDLWVEIVGKPVVRATHSQSRFFVYFGNRGNVDALAVPLRLSIPAPLSWALHFEVVPPPAQPGQVRLADWDYARLDVSPDVYQSGVSNIPLLLPLVPAGFTGVLEVRLTIPPLFPTGPLSPLVASIDDSVVNPTPADAFVQASLDGARSYVQQNFAQQVSAAVVPEVEDYIRTQLLNAVSQGRAGLAANVGTALPVFSMAWMQVDAAFFALKRTLQSQTQSAAAGLPELGRRLAARIADGVSSLRAVLTSSTVSAQSQNCPPYTGGTIIPGCSGGGHDKMVPMRCRSRPAVI